MAERYFPFDTGAGANVLEVEWAKMARRWLGSGVITGYLNQLQVFADNTGMQVKLPTGAAWIEGLYYENDAQANLPIVASDPTNPRIDRVVLRVDWTANTIAAVVKQGVAAGAPVVPALTQNFGVTWEFPLAYVNVAAGTGSIIAGAIGTERVFAVPYPANFIQRGTLVNRPPATLVAVGTLYHATDGVAPNISRSNGVTWDAFASSVTGIAAGSVGPTELASTAVAPGTYGTANIIPIITVDADGRITTATSAAASMLTVNIGDEAVTQAKLYRTVVGRSLPRLYAMR